MKEYEFVRFKSLTTGEESHKWWFAAKTVKQVIEHAEKFFKPTMQEGFNSAAHDAVEAIFKYGGIMAHATNEVASSIETITEIKGFKRSSPLALFDTANELLLTAINNRLKDIANGNVVYVEDGVRQFGYTLKNPHFEIVETYYSDKLEYPDFKKPTLDDVRFIQWEGGKHWYAKVNKEDITDEFGRQKWNSKEEAENAAKWYIEKYY
jgi:hypothetical protein